MLGLSKVALKVAGSTMLAVVVCLALMSGLVGCGGEEAAVGEPAAQVDEVLLGEWHSDGEMETVEFDADGNMFVTDDVEEGVLEFSVSAHGGTMSVTDSTGATRESKYWVEDDVLTIQCPLEDEPWVYERVTL